MHAPEPLHKSAVLNCWNLKGCSHTLRFANAHADPRYRIGSYQVDGEDEFELMVPGGITGQFERSTVDFYAADETLVGGYDADENTYLRQQVWRDECLWSVLWRN